MVDIIEWAHTVNWHRTIRYFLHQDTMPINEDNVHENFHQVDADRWVRITISSPTRSERARCNSFSSKITVSSHNLQPRIMIRDKRLLWHRNENYALKRIFTHRDLPDNKILQEIIKKIDTKYHSSTPRIQINMNSMNFITQFISHPYQSIMHSRSSTNETSKWITTAVKKLAARKVNVKSWNFVKIKVFPGMQRVKVLFWSIQEGFRYGWQKFEESIRSLSFQNIGCKLFAFVYFFHRWTDPNSTLHWRTRRTITVRKLDGRFNQDNGQDWRME